MRLSADFIAAAAGGGHSPPGLPTAGGVAFHSARVRPGDAFFALAGASEHGIEHADDALERGASFVVSDRPHPRSLLVTDARQTLFTLAAIARAQITGPVVGISGSAGKTSTKTFTAAALDGFASEGNLNTPVALACRLVDAWIEDRDRALVLELGIDRTGEMDELIDLVKPSHGLLTVIGESHLDGLGDLAGVAREKSRLLLRSPERFASMAAAKRLPEAVAGLVSYGLEPEASVAGTLRVDPNGVQRVQALGVELAIDYPGVAMAQNALGALAVAWRLGIDPQVAARRISVARLEPGRLEKKRLGGRLVLDDSYNSNPASSREALAALSGLPRPHIAVLGDMLELGQEAERLHRELGEATRGLDAVIAVGPLSRHLARANPAAAHVVSADDAIPLLQELPPGGTLLVKASRGMRLERVVAALEPDRVEA